MDKKITFLLIDDDIDDRELFELALDDTGFKPQFFGVGDACVALQLLKKGEVTPDYIFLDLNMPKMSGKECLKELKQHTNLGHIPVIIFSTSNNPLDIADTKALGAVDFIMKPPRISELTVILNNLVKHHYNTHPNN